MKKIWLVIFLGVFSYNIVQADPALTLKGRVRDAVTCLPIVAASVKINETARGTTSDNDGFFVIRNIADSILTVKVSMVGYETFTRTISLVSKEQRELTVFLRPVDIALDKITVTASRFAEQKFLTPANISITPEEKFDERTYSTVAEVLREEPGLLVQKTTYGHGAPIIRGLIGKDILLLYDGIRLNRPTYRIGGNQYLNTVDLGSLERVEVVRGPSSVMFGSDAIGGAINLIPARQVMGGAKLEVRPVLVSRYSSFDDGRSVNLSIKSTYRHLAGTMNFGLKRIGDLEAGGEVDKQSPTGWEESDFTGRLAWFLNQYSYFGFDYMAVRQDGVPRYDKYVCGEFEEYVYNPQDRDLAMVTFYGDRLGSVIPSVKAGVSYHRELEGSTMRKTAADNYTFARDKVTTWGGYVQLSSIPHPEHRLSFGWEYYYDRINSEQYRYEGATVETIRPTYPDDTRYYQAGWFLQEEWSLNKKWQLTAGMRFSYVGIEAPLEMPFRQYEDSFHDLTGLAAVSFKPVPSVNLIGRWSRGFRTPNLNDAVVLKYSSSGVDAPSPNLGPEFTNNFELGVKVENTRMSGGFFLFYDRLSDIIERTPGVYDGKTFFDENNNDIKDADEYDIYQRHNVNRARIFGFEFDNLVRLSGRWEIRANCFWTRGENLSEDEPLSRIPPLMGLLAIRYKPAERMWVEVLSRAADEQKRLSTRDIEDTRIGPDGTEGWFTLGLKYHLSIDPFTFNVLLENLTDKAYKEHGSGIYSPGRGIGLTLRYEG